FQNHTDCPLTDFGGKTSIFSHPVYLFLRKFSLQDSRGGSERLRQRSLANKLISLFRQFGGTELRLKLVWLCWLDLMTGNCLDDWTENLKRKSEKELEEWIINRQKQSAALTDLMDQYVLLSYRTTVDDKRT
ncbi:hypothetical protein, partial [Escherichia coli]